MMTRSVSDIVLPRGCAVAAIVTLGLLCSLCVTGCMGGLTIAMGLSNTIGPMFWRPTPCTIETFSVGQSGDPDSSSPTVEVQFKYVVNEKTYRSTKYSFTNNAADEQIVEAMHPGPATCYVNPSDPKAAVLVRGFNVRIFPILLPGLMILGFAIFGAVRRWRMGDDQRVEVKG